MTEHPDGSLWVYVPDGPGEPWLNPGVVQGPPGQQGPPGSQGPEGPPGTARILHLISAATTIQSQTAVPINGWSFPVEAGRSYHIRAMPQMARLGPNAIQLGLGGSAQGTVRATIQYHGSGQLNWNNTYPQDVWGAVAGMDLGATGGRLSCTIDGWVVVTVAGTVAVYASCNAAAPVVTVVDGCVMEVISTTAAAHFETFGEVSSAADPEWH